MPVSVQYAAFGEMTVSVEGVSYPLTRRRERDVLSVLLVAHGRPVAAERLVAEVWGNDAAGQTSAPLHVVISRLRGLLEPHRTARSGTRLVSTAAGYSLQADTADVDTWSFETHMEAARAATDPGDRLAGFDRALALWTGPPYAGTDAPEVRNEADRLADAYLALLEQRARALLDLGRPDEAQRSLAEVVTRHPYREGLWCLLALAQYNSSRQADALATLRTLRAALADGLGVDPLPETRQLEEEMLRQDRSLELVVPAPVVRIEPAPVRRPVGAAAGSQAPVTSIGRDLVHEQLVSIHRAAVDDRGFRVLLVAGEAGIGKSQLVSDVIGAVTPDGTRAVVGHCLEGEYAPPFWPWLRIVRPLADDALAHGGVDPLLEPLLSGDPPEGDAGSGATLRMFDAVVDLVRRAADRSPLLVVLEDLHWADESSLLLLSHLVASPPGNALTVLCTRRTTDARTADALVDTMATLARAGAERFRLDGLDLASVRALLDRWIGPHDTRLDGFVTDVTAGNPFFVLQYGRLLAATPDLADLDTADLPVPDGVRDVLRQRVSRLPDDAARLLASASVLGRHIDPDLLAELTGTPLDTCLDALDLALASGLLEEREAGYDFAHALARETLYADHSAARRMRLHDAAGRLVERRRRDDPDAVAEIAHHAHVAAPLGNEHAERACAWLARAAEVAVSRNAHPEALELWQRVLSDTSPRSLTAARADRGIAAALIRTGRMVEAHAALDSAVTIAGELGDWNLVAEAGAVLIRSGAWSWRELGTAHPPLVEVLTAAVPHVDPALQAQLLAILQMEHFFALQSDLVEDYGRRSVELARGVGDVPLLREVLMLRLIGSTGSWDAGARRALAMELLGLSLEGELAVTAQFHLGQVLWDTGDPDAADEANRRCAEAAATLRHTGLDIPLGWWRATRARDRDDPTHSALIDEALAAHRRAGYIASGELTCLHAVRRGPVGSPVEETTIALAEEGGTGPRALVAHALLEAGQPERAHALLGERVPDDIVNYCSTAGRCLRLLVLAETGTPEQIREALAPVEDHLGAPVSYGTIDHLGVVDHFVAAAYAALGDDRAVAVARSAVEHNRRLGVIPWLRRSEALLSRLS